MKCPDARSQLEGEGLIPRFRERETAVSERGQSGRWRRSDRLHDVDRVAVVTRSRELVGEKGCRVELLRRWVLGPARQQLLFEIGFRGNRKGRNESIDGVPIASL